MATGSTEIF